MQVVENSEESTVRAVMDSVLEYRTTVRDFALAKRPEDTVLAKDERRRLVRERQALLSASDKLRTDLAIHGVAIMASVPVLFSVDTSEPSSVVAELLHTLSINEPTDNRYESTI